MNHAALCDSQWDGAAYVGCRLTGYGWNSTRQPEEQRWSEEGLGKPGHKRKGYTTKKHGTVSKPMGAQGQKYRLMCRFIDDNGDKGNDYSTVHW
jgi:hypothetical protein